MRLLDDSEIRGIQLSILDDVHEFCMKNNIRYSLCGGTMIGAVRHKGYIPWDDDIDLMMPRTDYRKFIDAYSSKENRIIDLSTLDAYTEQFMKVYRIGTVQVERSHSMVPWGVGIDIFPVDGMPQPLEEYTKKVRKIHKKIMDICPYYKRAKEKRMFWFFKYCLKRVRYPSLKGMLRMKEQLNQLAERNLPEKSEYSTVIFGDFIVYPFPTEIFYEYDTVPFEGRELMCIKQRNLYLSTVYGDYMKLPPLEKRITHHSYDSFIVDE